MASIFDLKTSASELSSTNNGLSEMNYEQVSATRDVTKGNFSSGTIHYPFSVSGTKWWVPSRSYLRIRCAMEKTEGSALSMVDDVAPNMNLGSHLFQSGEFRFGSKTISRIPNNMAQIDAIEQRTTRSKAWMDSVGKTTNLMHADARERMNVISRDGIEHGSYAKDTVTVGLDFDAGTNTIAVDNAGIMTMAIAGGAALTVANLKVGDIVSVDGIEYKIQTITTDTVNSKVYQTDNQTVLAAAAAAARCNKIVRNNGNRRIRAFEIAYQPPLSAFKISHALPSGKYELVLTPHTESELYNRICESLNATRVKTTDFLFKIESMHLVVCTVEGQRFDNGSYYLDLDDVGCHIQDFSGEADNMEQRHFDVSPSTHAISVAFQDSRAGTDTRYSASKFKLGQAGSELQLDRFFLTYAGQSKPQPDGDPSYVPSTNTDRTLQRYLESQIYSGQYFNAGGCEPISEFHKRGAYYYFAYPRDGKDRSTRLSVNYKFSAAQANARVLAFDHHKKTALITVENGEIVSAIVEDA